MKTPDESKRPGLTGKEQMNRTPEIPGLIRRISNDERKFLWSHISGIAVAARLYGNVSEKDLARALEQVRLMHPLVGAKVVLTAPEEAWFSTDNVPETRLRIVERISDNQWFKEIQKEQMMPFEPEQGPLIRFVLVHSPGVSELIVFSAHIICDGTAVANLIRDILECYASPEKDVQVIPPPVMSDFIPEEGLSLAGIIKTAFIGNFNRKWRKRSYSFSQEDMNALHAAYWEKYRCNLVLLQLEKEETRKLVERCRAKGVTVVSAMSAAFIAAHDEVSGPFTKNQASVAIPFDLRRRLGVDCDDVFCLFVGGIQLPFSYGPTRSFWENAREIHRVMEKRVKNLDTSGQVRDMARFDPTLLDAMGNFALWGYYLPGAMHRTPTLSSFARDTKNVAYNLAEKFRTGFTGTVMTNLGRLDYPENYGDLILDRIFFLPSAGGEMVPLLLGGAGASGRLTFTANYAERRDGTGPVTTDDMIRIRNRALEHLGFPEKVSERAIE